MDRINSGGMGMTAEDFLKARAQQEKLQPIIQEAESNCKRNRELFEQGLLAESDYLGFCYTSWFLATVKAESIK